MKDTELSNLFANLAKHEVQDDNQMEWGALQSKLRRQNFLHFGLRHFNIYYVAAASVVVILSSVYIYLALNVSDARSATKKDTIDFIPATSKPARVDLNVAPITTNKTQNVANVTPQTLPTKTKKRDVVPQTSIAPAIVVDTPKQTAPAVATVPDVARQASLDTVTKVVNQTQELPTTKPVRIKSKKIIYKTTSDTLVQYDTLKVEKKKRKGLFGK